MPSARPRRTRRHGSHMGWLHEHARRGPGGGCCQACGARRIARWATQVVTVPRTRRGQGAAAGEDRQRLQRHWRDGWQVTAGGNGRLEARKALRICGARCAIAQRTAHSRGLRQSPRGCRWRRHLRRRHRRGGGVSGMTTFCAESIGCTIVIRCVTCPCDARRHAGS